MGTRWGEPSGRTVARWATGAVAKRRRTSPGGSVGIGLAQAKLWKDAVSEESDELGLVAADVVDVDLVEAHVDELLDVSRVLIRIRADQDAVGEVLRTHVPGHRREVFGVADVLLGERHAAIRPLDDRVPFGGVHAL